MGGMSGETWSVEVEVGGTSLANFWTCFSCFPQFVHLTRRSGSTLAIQNEHRTHLRWQHFRQVGCNCTDRSRGSRRDSHRETWKLVIKRKGNSNNGCWMRSDRQYLCVVRTRTIVMRHTRRDLWGNRQLPSSPRRPGSVIPDAFIVARWDETGNSTKMAPSPGSTNRVKKWRKDPPTAECTRGPVKGRRLVRRHEVTAGTANNKRNETATNTTLETCIYG